MNPRWEQWLACFFFSAGIGLLGWVTVLYLAPSPGPTLEVAETDIEVADAIPGQKREVVLRLQNTSGQPIRVFGLTEC